MPKKITCFIEGRGGRGMSCFLFLFCKTKRGLVERGRKPKNHFEVGGWVGLPEMKHDQIFSPHLP